MEEALQVAILGDADDEEIEYVILDNILINRDNVELREPNNFNLNELTDEEIKINFRFERADLPRLKEALRLPEEIVTETGNRINATKALCILLRRLAYPIRLCDLSPYFGLSPQSLSQIIRTIIDIIYDTQAHFLNNLNSLQWLNRDKLRYYAQAIQDKGGAVDNCWGFIDGIARPICRPTVNQEQYYSGHKRHHCIKYQSVLCPDGIIASLKGAYLGRRHDAGIFRDSMIYNELQQKAVFDENEIYVLFGDQAYGIMELLITPFPGRPEDLPAHQNNFNQSMKNLRVSVEWGFQKIVSLFAFVDFKKNQKLLLQDLESMFKVAVLLTNCHTCLYGSQTSHYFNTVPPTLEEYFGQ